MQFFSAAIKYSLNINYESTNGVACISIKFSKHASEIEHKGSVERKLGQNKIDAGVVFKIDAGVVLQVMYQLCN